MKETKLSEKSDLQAGDSVEIAQEKSGHRQPVYFQIRLGSLLWMILLLATTLAFGRSMWLESQLDQTQSVLAEKEKFLTFTFGLTQPKQPDAITLSIFENRYYDIKGIEAQTARLLIPEGVTVTAYSRLGELPDEGLGDPSIGHRLFAQTGPFSIVVVYHGLHHFDEFPENEIGCLMMIENSQFTMAANQTGDTLHWKELGEGFDGRLDHVDTILWREVGPPDDELLKLDEPIQILDIYERTPSGKKLGWQIWLEASLDSE